MRDHREVLVQEHKDHRWRPAVMTMMMVTAVVTAVVMVVVVLQDHSSPVATQMTMTVQTTTMVRGVQVQEFHQIRVLVQRSNLQGSWTESRKQLG